MKNVSKISKKIGQLLLVILISFFSGLLGSLTILHLEKNRIVVHKITTTITQTTVKNENSTTQAVDKVKDSVVSIIT